MFLTLRHFYNALFFNNKPSTTRYKPHLLPKYRKFGISQINILIFNMLPETKSSTVKL